AQEGPTPAQTRKRRLSQVNEEKEDHNRSTISPKHRKGLPALQEKSRREIQEGVRTNRRYL
ncbi:MAG: hypothetical protein COA94_03540, partial [Rickettsiales bacterium]